MFAGNTISSNDVYYRLYKSHRNNLMTVVCMQWFDEPDYDDTKFVRNVNGEKYYFDTEEEASLQLNKWYSQDQIDPEYRGITKDDLIR